ncbi:MAG: flagellar hook-length control protein FliK [Candidatus Margulisiibacteriota bacterium]|nr:flagellar hook-length control protein FliK [Candidatus Margulisiibacteriota bacterium]
MEIQLSQIHAPDAGLLQDSSAQNPPDQSFQNYLDEEQKRIALMFSPWAQFEFSSLFSYPAFTPETESYGRSDFLYEVEISPAEQNYSENYQRENHLARSGGFRLSDNFVPKPPEMMLQEILAKTGWLAPNLEASPLFFQAQMEGKLLSKLDLQYLVDQILAQVRLVKGKGKTELTVGLKPDDLGEIILTLIAKSGMVSIQIQAPEEIRKQLEALRKELEIALKRSNVNLSEIKIERIKEEHHA